MRSLDNLSIPPGILASVSEASSTSTKKLTTTVDNGQLNNTKPNINLALPALLTKSGNSTQESLFETPEPQQQIRNGVGGGNANLIGDQIIKDITEKVNNVNLTTTTTNESPSSPHDSTESTSSSTSRLDFPAEFSMFSAPNIIDSSLLHPSQRRKSAIFAQPYGSRRSLNAAPLLPTTTTSTPSIPIEPTKSPQLQNRDDQTPSEPNTKRRMSKYNSCSTLFADTGLVEADLQYTLKCIGLALSLQILRNEKNEKGLNELSVQEIFSEKSRPLSKHVRFDAKAPDEETLYHFFESLFKAADLGVECAIISLIYMDRMLQGTDTILQTVNWARVCLGAILLASKVWDDHAVWNVDFCQIFPDVEVTDMNDLERWYMHGIGYNVSIKASLYAKYYFELRDLADQHHKDWSLRPLNMDLANRLEAKLNDIQRLRYPDGVSRRKSVASETMRRSLSDHIFVPAKPPQVLM